MATKLAEFDRDTLRGLHRTKWRGTVFTQELKSARRLVRKGLAEENRRMFRLTPAGAELLSPPLLSPTPAASDK